MHTFCLLWAIQRCDKRCAFTKDTAGQTPLHRFLRKTAKGRSTKRQGRIAVLPELLKLAPETAKIPTPTGVYPLHLATRKNKVPWEEGLGLLVESFYPALAIKSNVKKGGLYPFQIAARRGGSLDDVYRLLRAKPDLIFLRSTTLSVSD